MEMTIQQVGGTHYQADYMHWDWVEDNGLGYLEGYATKYITRWRKSQTPLKDLKKARSCVMKLVDLHTNKGRNNRGHAGMASFNRFCHANQLTSPEDIGICFGLALWQDTRMLYATLELINTLIADNFPETVESHLSGDQNGWTAPTSAYVSQE